MGFVDVCVVCVLAVILVVDADGLRLKRHTVDNRGNQWRGQVSRFAGGNLNYHGSYHRDSSYHHGNPHNMHEHHHYHHDNRHYHDDNHQDYHGYDKGHHQDSDHSNKQEDNHVDNSGNHHGNNTDKPQEEKEYIFQVGNDFGAYEYLDANGYLKGFYVDMVKKVCEVAEKTCHVMYDDPEHCWSTDETKENPGVGLMSGWYDGCVGYSQSPERINSFDFTDPFTTNFQAGVYVSTNFDHTCQPMDLTGLRIGFIKGWSVNPNCISRQFNIEGNEVGKKYNASYYTEYQDMITAFIMGEIDAIFTVGEYVAEHLRLRPMCENTFKCTRAGISTMLRRGSPVRQWWNRAYDNMVTRGDYTRLCQKAVETHGYRGPIHCKET